MYLTQVLLLHMNFALHFGLDVFWEFLLLRHPQIYFLKAF